MSGQVDWYLHEGAGPDPGPEFLEPIDSTDGITWGQCGSRYVTLDAASIWPSLTVDDFLLAQISMEASSAGASALFPAPPGWIYIHWKSKFTVGAEIDRGPNCLWAYKFAKDGDTAQVFEHSVTAYSLCIKAWAIRNVDKRVPVDHLFYTAQNVDNAKWIGNLILTTRLHDFGGLQITSLGARDGGAHSHTWWIPTLIGPTPGHQIQWVMRDTYSDGSRPYNPGFDSYVTNVVYFDFPSETDYQELTQTPLAGSASGGLSRWTELNGSTSWISSTAGNQFRQVFGGPVGSLNRSYIKSGITLGPGQYIFSSNTYGRTPTDSVWYAMRVTCEDETTLKWGAYFLGQDGSYRGTFPTASLSFDYILSQGLIQDGTPSTGMGHVGCVFSLTQTHVVEFACLMLGEALNLDVRNTVRYTQIAAVNPTNKSIYTPYHIPRSDYFGVNRGLIGAAQWAPDEGTNVFYNLTFQVNRRGGRIGRFGYGGNGMTWGQGVPWPKPYVTNWRGNSIDDEGPGGLSDRWIWPKFFESNDAASETWGHYYFEMMTSAPLVAGFNYDEAAVYGMAPQNPFDGHSGTPRYCKFLGSSGVGYANSSAYFESLSATLIVYWGEGDIYGFEIDYANRFVRVTKDGAQICDFSITDQGVLMPFVLCASSSAPTSGKAWTVSHNFTGPFTHKPVGARALDWVNEVSL